MLKEQTLWQILEQITDPEIPVLSIVDLGIVRNISISKALPDSYRFPPASPVTATEQNFTVEITITPTYSGCPAMDVICINIRIALLQNGCKKIKIKQQLAPAWTTDWISEKGKQHLKAYGIAPPQAALNGLQTDRLKKMFSENEISIECPQCRSKNTNLLSQFGSTACKALYQCRDCKEPFDYFKCH